MITISRSQKHSHPTKDSRVPPFYCRNCLGDVLINTSFDKAWFPFGLFVPLVARFGFFIARFNFSSSDVRLCFLLLFVAFCCFLLPVVAPSGFSFLLMSMGRPELKQMNENGNEKCFLLLVLVFGACFHLPFVALFCFSLLVLVFEIESVLSQKPKQVNAFGCSFYFLLLVLVFCRCFHLNIALLVLFFDVWLFCWT